LIPFLFVYHVRLLAFECLHPPTLPLFAKYPVRKTFGSSSLNKDKSCCNYPNKCYTDFIEIIIDVLIHASVGYPVKEREIEMRKAVRMLTLAILIGILTGCTRPVPGGNAPGTDSDAPGGLPVAGTTDLQLSVQVSNSSEPFNTVGQVINYTYEVSSNDPDTDFPGPLVISDDKAIVTCPDLNLIGNGDNTLDPSESVTCTGTYSITQADLEAGKVINNASASLDNGAVTSNAVSLEVTIAQTGELILKTVADPASYDQVGQAITFTYEIINNGDVTLGPAQFTINDNLTGVPLDCGPAGSSLLPTESVICSATYSVTQADLDSGSVTSNATATDGTTTSDATMVTVSRSSSTQPPPASGLTPGTTIQHTVIPGDWLMQIARCYGADYKSVRRANPQIWNPAMIWSGQVVSVPNIGSAGTIYGPPCVVFHTAVAGDTWESLAQQYNARVDILKRVNSGGLFTGANIKVPINSAGGSSTQVPGTKRIDFPAGVTSVTETGTLTASGKVTYLVAGKNGQTMSVTLTAPAGEVAMGIYDPSGAILLNPADLTLTWNGKLTVDGDYRIESSGAAGITDKNYSLKVELTTLVGTLERVTNIRSESGGSLPRKPVVYNGALYFGAYEEDGSDRGLWKYDGNSLSLVAGNLGGSFGVGPAFLTAFNGALYFEADGDDGAGLELWKYDGASPPSLVFDIHKGPEGSNPANLAVYNGELYFKADDGKGAGRELWKYDGTNSPSLVEDIWDGPENSDPYDLAVYNGELYFNADDGEGAGSELWKYDGTSPPSLAENIWDGPESSDPLYLTVYNGTLYFSADNGEGAGYELWKYDGASSPSLAADIRSGPESSRLQDIAVYDGALYFSADSDGTEYVLWKYDATPVADIGDGFGYPAVYNGALYFSADGGDGAGMQLWRYTSP
jgi:ELWxxDGT repeat protein